MTEMQETTELVQPPINVPFTFKEVLASSKGSVAGYSAVSAWLTCPERSRLAAKSIRRRGGGEYEDDELSALSFGTLCHHLRALRVLHGPEAVEYALRTWKAEIPPKSWLKALLLFRTYENNFPRATDSLEYLGTEVEVVSNVAAPGQAPILRTVRYDSVVRLTELGGTSAIYSFEAKTMARAGESSLRAYWPQIMCQTALWNVNPHLVAKYGKMSGAIFDCLVKTTTPNVERLGPYYFGRPQTEIALRYLRLPSNGGVTFQRGDDGKFPALLHACWGRYRACDYINVCHEGTYGDFEDADGNVYEGD